MQKTIGTTDTPTTHRCVRHFRPKGHAQSAAERLTHTWSQAVTGLRDPVTLQHGKSQLRLCLLALPAGD